jgi:GT2 family glycosyltransferase
VKDQFTIKYDFVLDYEVDIIIPYHGQYERMKKCLLSVLRGTTHHKYNIYIVDDASPNPMFFHHLLKFPRTKGVQLSKQHGFGGALREGFRLSASPYVVFLNSDCVITSTHWLTTMLKSLLKLKERNVKMVSSKTNNPVGGDHRQKGSRNMEGGDIVLDDTHLSMYCVLCHRDLFLRVNGFIKPYQYGWYEDEEFAFRMRKHGYLQGISPAFVEHEGEATLKYLWDKDPAIKTVMKNNRKICLADIRSLT